MRTLVIGDIHGCSAALDHVLSMVRLQKDDTLITLGDYVDRGPDSKGVIDRLLQIKSHCRLVPLKGNHEVMMTSSRVDPDYEPTWRGHGGEQTLLSYGPEKQLSNVPPEHWDFLEHECLDYFETDTHIFVHANLWPDSPLSEQPDLMLFWEFLTSNQQPHCSGKTVICGHTAQNSGRPLNLGHTICLDTWVYGGGFLSCLDPGSGNICQASQSGMRREFNLRPQPAGKGLPAAKPPKTRRRPGNR
ncbi:MAG TPA: metallophosphoesterase family protein [Verrucomicrobiales bacterium]|jgi:serine/threonine protein phosphatase 1|nr:metallophosphoesterase family protein [Verrucomicrobiales bacterium]